jgi:diguanylate cyclase (GGDEF)-like protein
MLRSWLKKLRHSDSLATAVWLVAAMLMLAGVASSIRHLAEQHLAADAERVALGWSHHLARVVPDIDLVFLGEPPGPQAQDRLASLRGTAGLMHFSLFNAQGQLLLVSESLGTHARGSDVSPASTALARQVSERSVATTQLLHGDGKTMPLTYSQTWAPVHLGSQLAGVVEVTVDQSEMAQAIAASFRRAAMVAGAAVLVCLMAALAFNRKRADQTRAAREEANFLTQHDVLTGALNHGQFNLRLRQACDVEPSRNASGTSPGQGLSVICIDLDGFGAVNERHGHQVGDALLRQAGLRLQAVLRGGDSLARLAGDRFGILQRGASDGASVTALVERIVASLAQPYELPESDQPVRVTASVGAALRGVDGQDADSLLHNAELALLRAKSRGRGTWSFYDASLDRALKERQALASDLHTALELGQLLLHYQPVYAGDGSTLKGYEALARWSHPTRGMVPPVIFIPVAEETGLIERLGRWVLRAACKEAAQWSRPLSVAVNLSSAQFAKGQAIVEEVRQVLHETGLAPSRLELEITESLLMQQTDHVLGTLQALRALGVRIAMDDFGTGYSSLAYLWRFPFDKLKIDRAFTQGLGVDPRVDVIVRSIVRMAHSLSIRVNAEGVETEAQSEALRRCGCDELQGYLLGRPVPADLLAHLEAQTAAMVLTD